MLDLLRFRISKACAVEIPSAFAATFWIVTAAQPTGFRN